ncbi:MAG: chromosome segregation protein SMC, partial [Eubacteriales bacterium]
NSKGELLKQEIIDLLNDRASTKAKIQRFDTMLEQGNIRKTQINRRLIEIQTDKVDCQLILDGLQDEKTKMEQTVSSYQNQMLSIEKEIEEMHTAIASKVQEQKNAQTSYHREQSRLEALKNLTERYDGYGNSIRKVMERKTQVPGLLGVVADIIKTEKKYEVAIETALGGSIQNIVTDNDATAKQMVQYLKQNKLGRATFLPLTNIKGGQNIRHMEALKEKGVLGIASTLVQVENNYKSLSENLLGRTIVVETIDIGIALGRKYQHSLRIVTLEGELLNPGGSITGGAFKNTSNLLGRRREIEDLEEKVVTLSQSMNALEVEVETDKENRNLKYRALDNLKVELQKVSVLENTLKMKVTQTENKITEIEYLFAEISTESSELEEQHNKINASVKAINEELNLSETTEESTTVQIQEIQKEMEELRTSEVDAMRINEEIHLALASAKQKYDFVKENFDRIESEINKFQDELQELDQNKGNASDEINAKRQEITDFQDTIESSKELFVEIEVEIKNYTEQKDALTKKHKSLLNKREDITKQISDLDKEIFRLTSRKESYEELAEKNINYMWEEYEITYNYALELRDPNMMDLELMRRTIKTLKSDIKGLGSVNVNAIEDYKEVSERYIFLKTQHDDLIEAEQTLVAIIEELDAAMREQFKEQFSLISAEYDRVFKQLFGGGKGTLELMENEDILEAGVKIIAQPPGKKLQNMMQLSGGEKALTAISLLFAIQNLKPSPFCLLDEIEAALDDSNVVRFAQYLHKLTKHTQFIVITHRRGTMTAADRLYGITMQEKGVSTLVSVDLLQDELEKQEA